MDNPTGKQENLTEHGNEEQNNQTQRDDNAAEAPSGSEEEIFQEMEGTAGKADTQQDAPQQPGGGQGVAAGTGTTPNPNNDNPLQELAELLEKCLALPRAYFGIVCGTAFSYAEKEDWQHPEGAWHFCWRCH